MLKSRDRTYEVTVMVMEEWSQVSYNEIKLFSWTQGFRVWAKGSLWQRKRWCLVPKTKREKQLLIYGNWLNGNFYVIDGTPDEVKVSCPVWSGGKSGDSFKGLPITNSWLCSAASRPILLRLIFSRKLSETARFWLALSAVEGMTRRSHCRWRSARWWLPMSWSHFRMIASHKDTNQTPTYTTDWEKKDFILKNKGQKVAWKNANPSALIILSDSLLCNNPKWQFCHCVIHRNVIFGR